MYLVTHADSAFGGRIAARLLCSGEAVRAHVSGQQPSRRLNKLRTGGAEVIRELELSAPEEPDKRLWRGVTEVVHAAVSGTEGGKEAVASLTGLGAEAIIYAATTVRVRQLTLVIPPRAETHTLLRRSGLKYTLFYPQTLGPELKFGGGARGQLLERRRLVYLLPLQRVADVAVVASIGIKHALLRLPTEALRYHNVVEQVEQLLRRSTCPLPDALLAELVMGSPYKLITPGVARVLGVTFGSNYVEEVFAQAFEG